MRLGGAVESAPALALAVAVREAAVLAVESAPVVIGVPAGGVPAGGVPAGGVIAAVVVPGVIVVAPGLAPLVVVAVVVAVGGGAVVVAVVIGVLGAGLIAEYSLIYVTKYFLKSSIGTFLKWLCNLLKAAV